MLLDLAVPLCSTAGKGFVKVTAALGVLACTMVQRQRRVEDADRMKGWRTCGWTEAVMLGAGCQRLEAGTS